MRNGPARDTDADYILGFRQSGIGAEKTETIGVRIQRRVKRVAEVGVEARFRGHDREKFLSGAPGALINRRLFIVRQWGACRQVQSGNAFGDKKADRQAEKKQPRPRQEFIHMNTPWKSGARSISRAFSDRDISLNIKNAVLCEIFG